MSAGNDELILSVRGLRMGFASGFASTRQVLAAVDLSLIHI